MNQSQEVNGKYEGSNLDVSTEQLKDIIDLDFLQRLQDDFAKGVGLASVTVKLKGVTNTLNDGLGQISTTMEQLAATASDISIRQTNLNNEIASVNTVTEKINAVMDFIKEIAYETRFLGLNAAVKPTKAIEEANAIAATNAIEVALAIAAAKAIEVALAIAAANAIEEANATPLAKAVEGGLGLLVLGLVLGVAAQEIRKHLTGSKETVTMGNETTSTIEQQDDAPKQVTASVGQQGDLLGRRYRLSGQGNSGRRLFQR